MSAESTIEDSRVIASLIVFLCVFGLVLVIRNISRERNSAYYIEDAISDICTLWFLSLVVAAVLSYAVSKHIRTSGTSDASGVVFEDKEYGGYACSNSDSDLLRSENSTLKQLEDEDIYDYLEYEKQKLKDINGFTDADLKNIKRKNIVFRPGLFDYMDEYAFWFFDLVPLLEIPKTLEMCPAIKTDDFGKLLRLIFKIYVIFVFFGVSQKLWVAVSERKSKGADC